MMTLLYVDDEASIGSAVARWFERRGHTVYVATSIESATRLLAAYEPDAVFIDVWLGNESGFDLLSWIEDRHPQLTDRVTFVTGELGDDERAGKTWRSLGRPVLQKPFKFDQLEALAEAIQRRNGT